MIQELVSIAGSVGVPEEAFMSCMMYDDKCDESTRVAWKYGCSRTSTITPRDARVPFPSLLIGCL